MTRQKEERLKYLLENVPPGFLVDTPWLASRNIDRKLAYWYLKRGWLQPVAQGVYRRPAGADDNVRSSVGWKIAVISMQQLMGYNLHLGGRTALTVAGYRHYLAFSEKETVYLYGDSPTWLKRLSTTHKFVTRSRSLFHHPTVGVDEKQSFGSTQEPEEALSLSPKRWPLIMSSPERAILEMLNEIPKNESLHIVDKLFEGLSNLRPALLEELLRLCSSIKVKRYFLVFADRHQHAWRKHLSTAGIDLGSGPRFIFKGGRIHPEYKISVPADFLDTSGWDSQDGP